MTDFRWDDLRVFLAAYRTRSLTRAAVHAGLNQSTMSRRLAALEEAIGARLFDRTPEGLVPTEAAERLMPAAERAEAASHDALRAIDGRARELEGEVRFALSDGMAVFAIAPALGRFRAMHPNIELTLVVANAIADLSRREADLALRFVRPERGDLVAKRLFEGGYGLFARSPDHAAALIGWDADTQAHLRESQWEVQSGHAIAARATTLMARIAMARSGIGALALPVELGSRIEGLVQVPGEVAMRTEVWLVTHRALREVPRVRATWDFVEHVFEEMRIGAERQD